VSRTVDQRACRPRVWLPAPGRAAVLGVVLLTWGASAAAPRVQEIGCIGTTVSDLDRSVDFYVRLLGFRKDSDREEAGPELERRTGVFAARTRTARMILGSECLELTEYLAQRGRPVPADARSNDRDFQHVAIVVSDMQGAYARLRGAHVEYASSAPQELPAWNKAAGGIKAFYFRDPDRHVLEVIWFPEGKGGARWHAAGANVPLTLGIDHTAIGVADTDAALTFYRDRLGLAEAGHSENWGSEQVRGSSSSSTWLPATVGRTPPTSAEATSSTGTCVWWPPVGRDWSAPCAPATPASSPCPEMQVASPPSSLCVFVIPMVTSWSW